MRQFKQIRFGRLLSEAAAKPTFFDQVHVLFGGTGAVGGETVLRILDFFEDASRAPFAGQEKAPHVVATGHTRREIRGFTRLLFGVHERATGRRPERIEGVGYRMASRAVVELHTLSIDPAIPEMRSFARLDADARARAVAAFLDRTGLDASSTEKTKRDALSRAIAEEGGQPFTRFLETFRAERGVPGAGARFKSVVVTIPLASVATYQLGDLELFAKALGIEGPDELNALKETYLDEFPKDLGNVAMNLADEVLVAHTTGIGGMYDEAPDGTRTIRLGFAHSALGKKLRTKQLFAENLTERYSRLGIKILVTAAAIGVDAVLHRKVPAVQAAVRAKLERAIRDSHDVVPPSDLASGNLRIYRPKLIEVAGAQARDVAFESGDPMLVDYAVRSGENGFLTVSNADALYRVMRVATSNELGFALARVAVFGDDPQRPAFPENVCYYTETDYSRQVFDLLAQPALFQNQLSGLQPKALQDLGSSKHQAELHTLGLLILLHRLETLDLANIEPQVDLAYFDPVAYFESHSRPPTLEDVTTWRAEALADKLRALVTAQSDQEIAALRPYTDNHPERLEAVRRVLRAVQSAVWAIPSLGTPILYEKDGREWVASGYYVAPLDLVLTRETSIVEHLAAAYERATGVPAAGADPTALARFREFHFANGFCDLRASATLVTAHAADEDLSAHVTRVRTCEELLAALRRIPPYSYFTTSGLVALLLRLRGLACWANEMRYEWGSANEFRSHFPRDDADHALLVPGVVEAFRMTSEGLEKNTGAERLDGYWGYGWSYED